MKIILGIQLILSTLIISQSTLAQGVFNVKITQPDYVSNDWDGDGEINSVDTDDDNDGILDVDDDIPFGGIPGGSIVEEVSSGPICLEDADNYAVWMGSYMNYYINGNLVSPSKFQNINIRDFNLLGYRIYTGTPYTQICYEKQSPVTNGCINDINHKLYWRGNYFEYEIDGSYLSPTNRQSESDSGVSSREFTLFDKRIYTTSPFTEMCISDI